MLEKGTKVAGYEIEGILGHGGMGVVYEARQLSLGRTVALKILAGTLGMDPSFKERFRHEGRIQAALDHPHIVTIFEAGEWDDSLFIAMRLVRGPNLKEMIIARELEGARTLRILRPIAEALDSAHEAGLIHRDIKPQNILVGSRDRSYLADFGLTKGIDDAGLTQTGQFVGTIDYIAPEQIRGEQATAACDIYALSAVLYECLSGAVPYPKPSDAAVMYAHLSEPPPLVTDQRPELPPNLDEVICKGMDKDPKGRFVSATGLIDEAERALGKRVRAVITPPGPIEGPEEAGIREKEARVPTRPERVRRKPEPVPDPAPDPAAPTTPGAPVLAPAAAATAGSGRDGGGRGPVRRVGSGPVGPRGRARRLRRRPRRPHGRVPGCAARRLHRRARRPHGRVPGCAARGLHRRARRRDRRVPGGAAPGLRRRPRRPDRRLPRGPAAGIHSGRRDDRLPRRPARRLRRRARRPHRAAAGIRSGRRHDRFAGGPAAQPADGGLDGRPRLAADGRHARGRPGRFGAAAAREPGVRSDARWPGRRRACRAAARAGQALPHAADRGGGGRDRHRRAGRVPARQAGRGGPGAAGRHRPQLVDHRGRDQPALPRLVGAARRGAGDPGPEAAPTRSRSGPRRQRTAA